MALPAEKHRYTFADVLEWPDDEHVELIDGEIIMMAPPSSEHQMISFEICRQLGNYLEGKKCRAIPAPFAVRLFEGGDDCPENSDLMVEPDISIICDRNKIDKHGCKGAPDAVMEILSPSTRRDDRVRKFNLYQCAGVREYWIVNPEDQTVEVLLLNNGILVPHEVYGRSDVARVNVLEDCHIDLTKVFPE